MHNELTPTDVRLWQVEDLGDGSIPMSGKFLDCVLRIEGCAGRAVEVMIDGEAIEGGAFAIADDPHEVVIRGLSILRFGNEIPAFSIRDIE